MAHLKLNYANHFCHLQKLQKQEIVLYSRNSTCYPPQLIHFYNQEGLLFESMKKNLIKNGEFQG
jgi:hypothetical protein